MFIGAGIGLRVSKKLKKELKYLLDLEVKGDLVYELCSYRVMLIWVFLGVVVAQFFMNFTILCNFLWISPYCAIFGDFTILCFFLWISPCCAIVCEFHCTSYGVMFMRKFLVLLLYNFLWFFFVQFFKNFLQSNVDVGVSFLIVVQYIMNFTILCNFLLISTCCATLYELHCIVQETLAKKFITF